jgi:hypothetical protein
MGHCDVRTVTTNDPRQNIFFTFSLPAEMQLGRGGIYTFEDHLAWDQSFFYGLGMQCIRQDGLGHVDDLVRNVMNMTATTIPWPQVDGESGQRTVVQASNLAYSLLLPWILIESIFLIRWRRAAGQPAGELIMLLQLACVVLVAIVYFGDPRLRAPYDVFGLSLLAALIADRLGLDGRRAPDLRRGQGHPQANTPARVGRGPDPA